MTFNLGVLLGISFLSIVDLALRYFVFHRFESAAIDVALFAFTYSIIEAGRRFSDVAASAGVSTTSALTSGDNKLWEERSAVGFLLLLILAAVHIALDDRLDEQVDELLKRHEVGGRGQAVRANAMRAGTPMIKRSVLLTFSGPGFPKWIRGGKRSWRSNAAAFVNVMNPGASLDEESFLLPTGFRLAGGIVFFVAGFASLVTPAVTFT